jgi:hypothetical protein
MSVRAASPAYIIFQLAAAIALIALCVGYGFEDHQLDQCRQTLTKQTQAAQARTSAIRARQESLLAQAGETAKPLTQKK